MRCSEAKLPITTRHHSSLSVFGSVCGRSHSCRQVALLRTQFLSHLGYLGRLHPTGCEHSLPSSIGRCLSAASIVVSLESALGFLRAFFPHYYSTLACHTKIHICIVFVLFLILQSYWLDNHLPNAASTSAMKFQAPAPFSSVELSPIY